ncbi:MAG TPA: twin-arginine translocation signal domain-containing protein, partial [Armatimonadetes bacterium]|nr:twin-arginine translocation signal domain-containing protein [Armatimonadota bacterium]
MAEEKGLTRREFISKSAAGAAAL